MNQDTMLSLYDYLGHASGPELGKRVAYAATINKVIIDSREVLTRNYTGTILMYPKSFLDDFFNDRLPKPVQASEL
jgi:hypothetical protein